MTRKTVRNRGRGRSNNSSIWRRVLGVPGRIRAAMRARREHELLLDVSDQTYLDIGMSRGEIDFGVTNSHAD